MRSTEDQTEDQPRKPFPLQFARVCVACEVDSRYEC